MNDTGITLSREDADTIFRILGKSRDAIRKINPNLAQMIQGAQQLLVEPDGGEEAAQETEPDTAKDPNSETVEALQDSRDGNVERVDSVEEIQDESEAPERENSEPEEVAQDAAKQ